jgi:hypothetical protein
MFCFWAEIRISKQSQTILKNVPYDLKIFFFELHKKLKRTELYKKSKPEQ